MTTKDKINYLKEQLFILSMKDRWSIADYEKNRLLNNELRELTKEG